MPTLPSNPLESQYPQDSQVELASCAELEFQRREPSKPLCIDLYCGLGGWAEAFLAEGWDVIGFDNVRHDYGTGGYPGQLVLQDARTIDGRRFRGKANLIVASPPCQEYSYMAMPWSRGKQIAAALRKEVDFPEGYTGSRTIEQLNELFNTALRIAREAELPIVIENVKGAQPWVGQAKENFGSFYFWGDIDTVNGQIQAGPLKFGQILPAPKRGGKRNPDGTVNGQGSWFKQADSSNRGASTKNDGGSWFAIGSPGQTDVGQNPDGRKVPMNFHEHEKTGKPGRSFQSAAVEHTKVGGISFSGYGEPGYKPKAFNVTASQRYRDLKQFAEDHYPELIQGRKGPGGDWFADGKQGQDACAEGIKQHGSGAEWFDKGIAKHSSRSDSRKAASAQIAKIPFPLAQWIAQVFKPEVTPCPTARNLGRDNSSIPPTTSSKECLDRCDQELSLIEKSEEEGKLWLKVMGELDWQIEKQMIKEGK